MEYTRLTKEQTYYLEKCYAYLAKSHNYRQMYPDTIQLEGINYTKDTIKEWITEILIEKYYKPSDVKWLNDLKEFYINKRNESKLLKREETTAKPKI